MRVGVSTASLFNRKYNEDALALFNEIGIQTAEVFLTSFSEYGEAFGKLLASKKGNVESIMTCAQFPARFHYFFKPKEGVRFRSVVRAKKLRFELGI